MSAQTLEVSLLRSRKWCSVSKEMHGQWSSVLRHATNEQAPPPSPSPLATARPRSECLSGFCVTVGKQRCERQVLRGRPLPPDCSPVVLPGGSSIGGFPDFVNFVGRMDPEKFQKAAGELLFFFFFFGELPTAHDLDRLWHILSISYCIYAVVRFCARAVRGRPHPRGMCGRALSCRSMISIWVRTKAFHGS